MRIIRKVREFSDSAKEDIRSELGPEFKDFEFEDLNPKTFIRKNLMNGEEDEYGLGDLQQIGRNASTCARRWPTSRTRSTVWTPARPPGRRAAGGVRLRRRVPGSAHADRLRQADAPRAAEDEPPPFDADAT